MRHTSFPLCSIIYCNARWVFEQTVFFFSDFSRERGLPPSPFQLIFYLVIHHTSTVVRSRTRVVRSRFFSSLGRTRILLRARTLREYRFVLLYDVSYVSNLLPENFSNRPSRHFGRFRENPLSLNISKYLCSGYGNGHTSLM